MPIESDIVGRWKLIDFLVDFPDGTQMAPFGESPQGWGIYSADGWMSAQLMQTGRPPLGTERLADAPPDVLLTAAKQYIGYAGRYSVDVSAGIVSHFVEVAFLPDWIGTVHRRHYRFEDGMLLLSPDDREGVRSTLRWQREGS